jgi:hypothetical protein
MSAKQPRPVRTGSMIAESERAERAGVARIVQVTSATQAGKAAEKEKNLCASIEIERAIFVKGKRELATGASGARYRCPPYSINSVIPPSGTRS